MTVFAAKKNIFILKHEEKMKCKLIFFRSDRESIKPAIDVVSVNDTVPKSYNKGNCFSELNIYKLMF